MSLTDPIHALVYLAYMITACALLYDYHPCHRATSVLTNAQQFKDLDLGVRNEAPRETWHAS